MKKLFIIAAAAVAALAACTKTEVNTPDQAINFNAANYISRVTKANVTFGTANTFKTNAYVHTLVLNAGTPEASIQQMMFDETVAWNGTLNQWLPSRTYFWPKTGYVNFFSYAGSIDPTAKAENSLTYTGVTINTTDDILVAEAAYEQTGNLSTYHIDNAGVTGVPTLFHHMLSKVSFKVKLDATDAYAGIPEHPEYYSWEIVVNESKFGYVNKGTAEFTFADGQGADVAAPVGNQQLWNAPTGDFAWTIVANNKDSELESTVIGDANKMTATNSAKVSEIKTLFDEISVLPQDLNDTDAWGQFSLQYTIKSTYDDSSNPAKTITEVVTVPLTDILTYVPSITGWKMNYKYIYNIIIKPGEPVKFDPAVVEWEEETAADKII
ncbi:MAG: fimbrillin family protein [Bacteroidales bacterium]|nr:fimbrillin family protein [Bacteroidales bacterium]